MDCRCRNRTNLETIIDLLAATGGQIPLRYINLGHIIKPFPGTGIIGGYLSQIFTDHLGRLTAINAQVSSIIGCGHMVTSLKEISGFCQICGRLCCKKEGCLEACDFLGITVCRRHYKIKEGIVVSSKAQKGLWKRKAKKLAIQRELLNAGKQIPEQT